MSKKILLSIDPLLHKKIENEAQRKNISVTEFINNQLENYFSKKNISDELDEIKSMIERTNNLSEAYIDSIILFFDLLDDVTTPSSYLLEQFILDEQELTD